MLIRDIFAADVTRDIPPVVYFHEQSPARIQAEVSEYIITGGHSEGDPRAKRSVGTGNLGGIHEQLVHLLQGIAKELAKKGGPELPAVWISGFYGSGKSSFAKLVGLALDGTVLPDGTPFERALLARDDSPRREELLHAWNELRKRVEPIAVVFDIGGAARDDEHIHSAVLRQLQVRLGYCPTSDLVAKHELKLEQDGEWERFLGVARETLGKDWREAMQEEQADDHFSHVLHAMNPERYRDPTSWIDGRAGRQTGAGTSVREVVADIAAMLAHRAKGKTLFIVADEVSQYLQEDDGRILKLQSFVSELGQKLKGRVWIFATGQQKLEDQAEQSNTGKLKDRFPRQLRVHLDTTNIRDVVHKRLLSKAPAHLGKLRELFQKHRSDLKLYGYGCEAITEEDFVEVYPMLPEHIDLLMQITSNLRSRSPQTQGDGRAVRGLLQLLGELFREQRLADQPLGKLVTLDAIFEAQHTALDADVQATIAKLLTHTEVLGDAVAQRAARAVALLELIQEQTPTTPELVAASLYARLGEGNQVRAVTQALEKLRDLNLLAYSERTGFKIQTSAGLEWERERQDFPVAFETISEMVQDTLKALVGNPQERPKYKGRGFPWALYFSDGQQAHDLKLMDAREDSTVVVDFRLIKEGREAAAWIQKSTQEQLANRLLWVAGEGAVEAVARDFARSKKMVDRYRPRWASLSKAKQQLVLGEETRLDDLEKAVQKAVASAFHGGALYFRGQEWRPPDLGAAFFPSLMAAATRILPELYPLTTELIALTDTELLQLLGADLVGPSTKFLESGLGLLSLDNGQYMAACKGEHPRRIAAEIERLGGASGQTLITTFASPPYGYPSDLVRACCAGLLRGGKVRINPEVGDEIKSYRDAGVRELFTKARAFRKAEFLPAAEAPISHRDRVAIGRFFESAFEAKLDRENEAFADAAFRYFPHRRDVLREVERRFHGLPGRPTLPERLTKLGKALEDCCRHRPTDKVALELKRNLDVLRDGMDQLRTVKEELTTEAAAAVRDAAEVRDHHLAQLVENAGLAPDSDPPEPSDSPRLTDLEEDAAAIREHLQSETPWRGIHAITDVCQRLRERYVEVRRSILRQQSAETEAALARLRLTPGFEALTPDQGHAILKPLLEAEFDTTPEAVSPTLRVLRESFPSRLGAAGEQALDRLDEERSRSTGQKVVKIDANLHGREIQSREQLQALFRALEERIGPLLDRGDRVRIG